MLGRILRTSVIALMPLLPRSRLHVLQVKGTCGVEGIASNEVVKGSAMPTNVPSSTVSQALSLLTPGLEAKGTLSAITGSRTAFISP